MSNDALWRRNKRWCILTTVHSKYQFTMHCEVFGFQQEWLNQFSLEKLGQKLELFPSGSLKLCQKATKTSKLKEWKWFSFMLLRLRFWARVLRQNFSFKREEEKELANPSESLTHLQWKQLPKKFFSKNICFINGWDELVLNKYFFHNFFLFIYTTISAA